MAALSTLAILGLTTGLDLYGQKRQGDAAVAGGRAEQEAAESQARLSDYNATVAEQQAADATFRGGTEENKFRTGIRQLIGEQRADFAAGNVDVGSGSPLDVQAESARLGELDALTIRNNAALEAWGFRTQAVDLRNRAAITRRAGANAAAAGREAQRASRIGMATTLLGTSASVLSQKYGFGVKGQDTRLRSTSLTGYTERPG